MNDLMEFIKFFSKFNGKFEYIMKGYIINKVLFVFKNNDFLLIKKYFYNKGLFTPSIDSIFNKYGNEINHIGFDNCDKRYKIYISLYNKTFEDSLKIINICRNILNINKEYYIEKDFYKFDCIGIDFSEKGFNLKIYELVEKDKYFIGLPTFIKITNIKEIGFLKNFIGRKKIFIRLKPYMNLNKFLNKKQATLVQIFINKIKNFSKVEKRVKYYCIEGDKKEIYFI